MRTRKKSGNKAVGRKKIAPGKASRQDPQDSYNALSAAQAELVRKTRIETIGNIARVLNHEAHNLLGALGTCVQVLRRNPQLRSEDAELLDIIQSGSKRLDEIVSEFATFGQPKSPQFQDVSVHDLIEETLALLQRDDRCPASVVIRCSFDPSVRVVQGDRSQLGQVLWIVLLNSAQAIREQGQIEIETRSAGRNVEVIVRDTGAGIPKDILPHIFEPLCSTKSRAVGLGLPIARSFIEAHKGRITVRSENGVGTSVVVWIPINPRLSRSKPAVRKATG